MISGSLPNRGREYTSLSKWGLRNSAKESWGIRLLTGKLFLPLEFCSIKRVLCGIGFLAANSLTRFFFSMFSAFGIQRIHKATWGYSVRTDTATWAFDTSTWLRAVKRVLYIGSVTTWLVFFGLSEWKILYSFSHWEIILPSLIEMPSFITGVEEVFIC